jgi:hypothetical protein
LQKIQDFLLFFYDATSVTEGCSATIDSVLPKMDFLLERFETAKCTYINDPFMSPCCNSGWAKLDKYYSLTERSPVYIAALVLSLQWKWDYICERMINRAENLVFLDIADYYYNIYI